MTNITVICHIFHEIHVLNSAPQSLCPEVENIYEQSAEHLIFGTSKYDTASLSNEVAKFFKGKSIKVQGLVAKKAIPVWNEAKDIILGLFHITCQPDAFPILKLLLICLPL
jgi:hypothetical protein